MCTFRHIPQKDIVISNALAFVVLDKFAKTRHHYLSIIQLLKAATDYQGCNLQINQGKIAGQTIDYLHQHVVMRYQEDDLNVLGDNF